MSSIKNWFLPLYMQVLWGIVIGIVLGLISPEIAEKMKPLGDGFIHLIKMAIPPIIFCTVVTGIAHMGDMKKAGKLGLKAIIYFEIVTTIALVLGLIVGNFTASGSDLHVPVPAVEAGVTADSDTDATASATQAPAAAATQAQPAAPKVEVKEHSTVDFLMGLIPHTFFSGIVNGDLLQTLLVAILFAWAMLGMGKTAAPILESIDAISHVFFRIVGIIMRLAPLGAFGAIAYTVSKFGGSSLTELLSFVLLFYATCIFFIVAVCGGILKVTTGLSILQLIRYIKSELLIVLGTSSSETVLPRILDKLERVGCERQVVGMVLPTGYSFNLDGSSLYFTMAVLFLAHASGVELSLSDQMGILGILLVTSKGAAGVVGSAFIVLTGTLATLGGIIPPESAALLLGIDRFMSTGRALTNLIGNCSATLIVGHWEKSLDVERAKGVLSGKIETHGDTDMTSIALKAAPGLESHS